MENISKLSNESHSGGTLPSDVGDAVSKRTRLFGSMASTETGILSAKILPPEMWNYYRYNERLGHAFRHSADDLYELVLTSDKTKEPLQIPFYTFLDADTYEMRDL